MYTGCPGKVGRDRDKDVFFNEVAVVSAAKIRLRVDARSRRVASVATTADIFLIDIPMKIPSKEDFVGNCAPGTIRAVFFAASLAASDVKSTTSVFMKCVKCKANCV